MSHPANNLSVERAGSSLNWGGSLLLGLIFALGVALCLYLGLIAGIYAGVELGAEAAENTPHQNTGMAPDLTPAINAFFAFAKSAIAGTFIGLVVGLVAMWAALKYLLAPLFRSSSFLSTATA
jgi:hypothetical protein